MNAEVTGLPISPGTINIGSELTGSSGGSADLTRYTEQFRWDALCPSGTPDTPSPLVEPGVPGDCGGGARSYLHAIRTTGAVISNNPPAAGWLAAPTPTLPGTFATQCCVEGSPLPGGVRDGGPPGGSRSNGAGRSWFPQGLAAIQPVYKGKIPSYPLSAAIAWVKAHSLPKEQRVAITGIGAVQITDADVRKLFHDSAGRPAKWPLVYVGVQGSFTYPAPPPGPVAQFSREFAIFDAVSGNLLLSGGRAVPSDKTHDRPR